MSIDRSETLFPVNSPTVDSGGGADVRTLADSNGGTNDASQTVQATHTQDNAERTFDPATTAVVVANNCTTLQKLGYALPLTSMTPTDDTNCNCMLPAGSLTLSLDATLTVSASGSDLGGTQTPTFKGALFKYNTTSDAGTLIASGSTSAISWSTIPITGDQGTFKVATITITWASVADFAQDDILLLQIGLNTGTLTNPVTGTNTYTITLRVDDTNTKIVFDSGKGLHQACIFDNSLVGKGTASKEPLPITMSLNTIGKGVPASSKVTVISKSFSLVGSGVPTFTKAVAAIRSFNLEGYGNINGKIELPIDEIPEEATPSIIFAVLD